MERTDIKEALERVYKESYPGFVCPYISECGKDMHEYGHRFSKAKLGSDYGKTTKPRVLFVGKEGAKDGVDPKDVQIDEPIALSDPNMRKDNWHYIGLIYSAGYLLTNDWARLDAISPDEISVNTMMPYEDLRHEICLTNYFKCAFKKKEDEGTYHNVFTNKAMQQNCVRILLAEIGVLHPDIVIVQGKFSHSSFWNKKGLLSSALVCYPSRGQ